MHRHLHKRLLLLCGSGHSYVSPLKLYRARTGKQISGAFGTAVHAGNKPCKFFQSNKDGQRATSSCLLASPMVRQPVNCLVSNAAWHQAVQALRNGARNLISVSAGIQVIYATYRLQHTRYVTKSHGTCYIQTLVAGRNNDNPGAAESF